ncbi:zinc-binding alcohol dehydrogenase family protein [Alteromonas sp. 14N.309.X.WAT.G.H12]|uniref:zinc-binding alcohol dehydrogenase family protein n=1 Tax=Alteromonas sp. 14N.309.X.WAT.G.H12 TaxID=3120824 RepID=UPI002FD6C2F1
MRAYGYKQASETLSDTTIQAVNIAKPIPAGRDVLIQIHGVSVNPVDTKIRKSVSPPADELKILGWDAVGVVADVGSGVSMFKKGDRVFYAGDVSRPGSNAEYQLVDERIVGRAPSSLSDEQAVAMPLTSLTAYELLFDRLNVTKGKESQGQTILITGAAGGVGSVLVQLARQLTGLTIVGTASRPESQAWVKRMGAHHVIDHNGSLTEQFTELGLSGADYIASLTHTNVHFEALADIVKPQGKIGLIDDPGSLDIGLIKRKSVSLHWEFMYTRSLFNTKDIGKQQAILNEISQMLDTGTLISTLGQHLGPVNAQNIIKAHRLLESNKCIGKLVLAPFEYA